MDDGEPSTSKRAHLNDDDDVEIAIGNDTLTFGATLIDGQDGGEDVEMALDPKGNKSQLLQAARLAKIIHHQPRYGLYVPPCLLAWSDTNTIAISRSSRITLVHILAPSRVANLPTVGRASLLSFSPKGDALLATFPDNRRTCLWCRERGTLNEWRLTGEWNTFEGRVLDAQWLAAGRKVTRDLRKNPFKGPQIDPTNSDSLALLLVTDAGQIILLQCERNKGQSFRVSSTKLDLGSQMRLRQASLGLVADESLALLAYSKRTSSKSSPTNPDVDSRTMQMFFDDANTVTQDEEKATSTEDGQDRLHIAEVRLDLYDQDTTTAVSVRPVLPIFVASYDDPELPFVDKITQLVWHHGSTQQSEDDSCFPLRLFASFVDEDTTTLRTWTVQREDSNKLSSAFTNLNSGKEVKDIEGEEDWVAIDGRTEKYDQLQIGDFVTTDSSHQTLLCSVIELPEFKSVQDTPNIKISWRVLDLESLCLVDAEERTTAPTFRSQALRLAVSPHSNLAVGAVRGKLTVTRINGLQTSSTETMLATAILNDEDMSDVTSTSSIKVAVDGITNKLAGSSGLRLPSALQLISLRCRLVDDDAVRRSSLALLMMIDSQRVLTMASADRDASTFNLEHTHALVAHFRWYVKFTQELVKQAYLSHVQDGVSSPADSQGAADRNDLTSAQIDLLSLFAHPTVRALACKTVARLVAFYNFIATVAAGAGSEATRTAFKAYAGRCVRRGDIPLTMDTFAVCCAQLREVLNESAIDISRLGRLLKTFDVSGKETADKVDLPAWYLGTPVADSIRARLATGIVEAKCIVDPLRLCCPEEQWESSLSDMVQESGELKIDKKRKRTSPEFDILTRASLPRGFDRQQVCLSCDGVTQIALQADTRCLCGAKTWWATQQQS